MKHILPIWILAFCLAACQAGAPAEAVSSTPGPAEAAPSSVPTGGDPFLVFTVTPMPAPTGTPTAVPPQMRTSPADGMPQVFVPAGVLHRGGMDVNIENDELPARDVQVHAFWIDQLEVTNGMYGLCVQAGACRLPVKISSQKRPSYFGNPEFQDYPVVQVAWTDASAYCEWAGRRLPSEAEWERAARGDDTRTYPWGDELPTEAYANYDNLIRDTSRVGSYSAGASPFGALDMAGNVWEWVEDVYDHDFYKTASLTDPLAAPDSTSGFRRVIRGGSFQDSWLDLRVSNRGYEMGPNPRAAYQSLDYYGHSSVKIGFRCAADP